MPIGYTTKLMEKGQTFQEFMTECACAFGVFSLMRDDPLDVPIPEKIKPSARYQKIKDKVEANHAFLKAMSDSEKVVFGNSKKESSLKVAMEYFNIIMAENKRLEDMKIQVKAWVPPSEDHQRLKDFMFSQIDISKHDRDYYENRILEIKMRSPESYYVQELSRTVKDIKYYEEKIQNEIDQCKKKSEWIKLLQNSI